MTGGHEAAGSSPVIPILKNYKGECFRAYYIDNMASTIDPSRFKNFLQLVLDNVPAFIFWKDSESRYLGCNKAYAEAVRLRNPGEIIGKNDFDFYPKKFAQKYQFDDRVVIRTGKPKTRYEEIWFFEQQHLWVETTKVPLKDNDGNTIGVLGLYRDITLEKKEEERIKSKLQDQLDRINSY